jgi:hypothetical protein
MDLMFNCIKLNQYRYYCVKDRLKFKEIFNFVVPVIFKNEFLKCFYEKAYQFLPIFLKAANEVTKELSKAASTHIKCFRKTLEIF